ncbi:MAG: DUF6585 family protein [Myxococcota bacterium]
MATEGGGDDDDDNGERLSPVLTVLPRPGRRSRVLAWSLFLGGLLAIRAVGWLGLFIVGLAPLVWLGAVLTRPQRIQLFADGVEVSTFWDPTARMSFREVHSVFRIPARRGRTSALVLVDEGGHRVTLPRVDRRVDAMVAAVRRACIDPVRDEAQQALAGGARLYFGPLQLDPRALGWRGRDIPWGAVTRVVVRDAALAIEGHTGTIAVVQVDDVPYPTVLLTLLEQLDVPLHAHASWTTWGHREPGLDS